jgi:hypothetical protein
MLKIHKYQRKHQMRFYQDPEVWYSRLSFWPLLPGPWGIGIVGYHSDHFYQDPEVLVTNFTEEDLQYMLKILDCVCYWQSLFWTVYVFGVCMFVMILPLFVTFRSCIFELCMNVLRECFRSMNRIYELCVNVLRECIMMYSPFCFRSMNRIYELCVNVLRECIMMYSPVCFRSMNRIYELCMNVF